MPNGEALGYAMGDQRPLNASVMAIVAPHRINVAPKHPVNETLMNSSRPDGVHPWGIFFTVLGTVLLDFDADACQSPARAYLLDVTLTGVLVAEGCKTKTIRK